MCHIMNGLLEIRVHALIGIGFNFDIISAYGYNLQYNNYTKCILIMLPAQLWLIVTLLRS